MSNGTATCAMDPEDVADDVVGWIILAGIPISFLPQYYQLVKQANSKTISGFSWFLVVSVNLAQCSNAYILTFHHRFLCCASTWALYDW
jgi:hypothetical protein